MYRGFKMLIDQNMNPKIDNTCLKKAYRLSFFIVLNMIFWKITQHDYNIEIFIIDIFAICLIIFGRIKGYKLFWYNKYFIPIIAFLLLVLYGVAVCLVLSKT
jgi:amino acid permease